MNVPAKRAFLRARSPGKQRGASILVVGVSMAALIGFAALAIDIGNLYVARNELQNAADAGALAGARCLYNNADPLPACNYTGAVGQVNTGANGVAFAAARANNSQRTAVDVNWAAGSNAGSDVERGHWSFATRTFTPNNSTAPVNLWDVSTAALDANTNFINAVRVTARRQATPVAAFFARIFGTANFQVSAQAVAWIGFAGTLGPGEADEPIAICKDKLLNGDQYTCSVGRFIPSTSETGGWISFQQGSSCPGTASVTDTRPAICASGNPNPLVFGNQLSANNGQEQIIYQDLTNCWTAATNRIRSWNLTLPVLDCVGNNIAPCSRLVGAVNVNVVWIQFGSPRDSGSLGSPTRTFNCNTDVDRNDQNAPCRMDGWDGTAITDNILRWNSFANYFNLRVPGGAAATWENGGWRQKTIYFKPDCTPHDPGGTSEGENFGILADIPRLVN